MPAKKSKSRKAATTPEVDYGALDNFTATSSGGLRNWFRPRPKEGKPTTYRVRLLPAVSPMPLAKARLHYFGSPPNSKGGRCPQDFGEDCPACELFFTLISHEKMKRPPRGTNPMRERLRDIAPAQRVYVNLLDLDDQDRGPLVFSMPPSVFERLEELVKDKDGGKDWSKLFDPAKGRSVAFTTAPQGVAFRYEGFILNPRASKIPYKTWQQEVHDLEQMVNQKKWEKEELQQQLEDALGDEIMALWEGVKGK